MRTDEIDRRVLRPTTDYRLTAKAGVRPTPGTSSLSVRLFDVVGAALLLLVASPVMALIAAVLYFEGGPVLFRSDRLGAGGRPLAILKYRSMYPDAEGRLKPLLESNDELRRQYEQHRKLHDDPRVTTLGRVLRRLSFDELPQLFNVLSGDLSLVGPRPKLPDEQAIYGEQLAVVLRVKPGLTGLWQVNGRSKLTLEERVLLDVRYVLTRTLRGDLKIVALTAWQLFRPSKYGAM